MQVEQRNQHEIENFFSVLRHKLNEAVKVINWKVTEFNKVLTYLAEKIAKEEQRYVTLEAEWDMASSRKVIESYKTKINEDKNLFIGQINYFKALFLKQIQEYQNRNAELNVVVPPEIDVNNSILTLDPVFEEGQIKLVKLLSKPEDVTQLADSSSLDLDAIDKQVNKELNTFAKSRGLGKEGDAQLEEEFDRKYKDWTKKPKQDK